MADDYEAAASTSTEVPAEKPQQMTDEDLLDIIFRYEKNSLGSEVAAGASIGSVTGDTDKTMTSLEIDRYNALNTYFARPLGNETETSSTVVWPELRDTVEWIMPQLMRIFMAAQSPCVFDPEGPDDVRQAQIETAAVNHVFMRMNDGFMVVHDYCKDSMLLRNGYVSTCSELVNDVSEETYSGLNEAQLTQLLSDKGGEDEVEVVGQHEEETVIPPPLDAPPGTPSQKANLFSVRLRIRKEVRKILVEAVPPEEMRIAAGTRSNDLNKSPFVMHKTKKTRSALITEGYDEATVNGLSALPDDWFEMDALARNKVIDQLQLDEDEGDRSQQEIQIRSVTLSVDFDGDGVSERRQILVAGNQILDNEVVEECPISSGVPKRMPHRHTGISLYDELLDIQVIKSELMRQGLNSLRLAVNPRIGVDWKNCSLGDLMTWRSGGVVRTNGNPQSVLFPFTSPTGMMQQIAPMLEVMDKARTMRTGVGEHTMGLDADALQDVTKGGQLAAMSAASLKVEMVARLLAEGLKDVYLKIHALLIRHQDVPLKFQMGETWQETDPRKWRKRTRVSPNVGLGSGNREEMRANLAMLGTIQEKAAAMGLVGPKQVYATSKMAIALIGYEHPESFVLDPDGQEYKQLQAQRQAQTPQDPRVAAATINAKVKQQDIQARLQETKMEQQTEQTRAQAEVLHSALQNKEDRDVQMAGMDVKLFTDLAKILATIVAGQLKEQANVNAGAVLRQDVQSLEGR